MEEDFDGRLRAAQKAHAPPAGDSGTASEAWGVGARVGVELLAALMVGMGIGWALDRWLHTLPLFLVLFLLLGGAAGVVNVWRLVGK